MDHDPYGLSDRPFQLTPDPRFYYESSTHRKAMTYLGYGLAQGEGFIVVTGEVGTGKTMLVGRLMATIDRSRLTAINLVSTQLEGEDILRIVALALGVATDVAAKGQLLARIERFLHEQARGGKRTLLIVDEAQNLPISALEELRMLSNFQFGGQALLQIFLLGQPEFRDALAQPRFEQLRQRVIATHHLTAMGPEEVAPYIMHRLACAGWKGTPRFTGDAYAAFHRLSGGIPRRLNMLAGRVMLQGAIERLTDIDGEVVEDVAADLASESIMPAEGPMPRAQAMPFEGVEPQQTAPLAPMADIPAAMPPMPREPAPPLPPARPPGLPSYDSYAPPEDDEGPAPFGAAYAADQGQPSGLSGHTPPPAMQQPPRYDGYVPPEAAAMTPPLPSARPPVQPFDAQNFGFTPPPEPPAAVPSAGSVFVPPVEPAAAPPPESFFTSPSQPASAPPVQTYAPPPEPATAPAPLAAQPAAPQPAPVQPVAPAPQPPADDVAARNAQLETQLAEQADFLRRTLSLLAELVETETEPQTPPDPQGSGGSQDAA